MTPSREGVSVGLTFVLLVPFQLFGTISLELQGEPLSPIKFSFAPLQGSFTWPGVRFAQARFRVDELQRAPMAPGIDSPLEVLADRHPQIPSRARIPRALLEALWDGGEMQRRIRLERQWLSCAV